MPTESLHRLQYIAAPRIGYKGLFRKHGCKYKGVKLITKEIIQSVSQLLVQHPKKYEDVDED